MRWWRKALLVGGGLLALGWGAWMLAPWLVADCFPRLAERPVVTVHRDIRGDVLWFERPASGEWCFPVPLEAISPAVIQATLAAEDARFYAHHGVSYRDSVRALVQNLRQRRIVSGASTITMQVASLAMGRERSLWGKFLQATRARKIERCHTKDEILNLYLNRAPYGGQLVGIEAAARFYFGRSAKELTLAEATLLCGLPQQPNRLRPDRHLDAARRRQHYLLERMVARGMLAQAEADDCFAKAPLRLRNFKEPADFERLAHPKEAFHAIRAGYTIDGTLQAQVLTRLRQRVALLPGVQDAACVILPNQPGASPLVYLGTLWFDSPRAGQVDAAKAHRSAGSTLKPFLFAEAMEAGLLVPETQLLDAPLRFGTYAPANYDGSHAGSVSAREALSASLNTTAVRLVAQLGEGRVVRRLTALGLSPAEVSGLSLALGTGGASLLALTRAYQSLPIAFSPATAQLIAKMLRRRLPQCTLDVAWKTGTANNNTDAWCVGWTPDFVVGIWLGNKSGARSESLVGAEVAAPLVGEVMTLLYRGKPAPRWEEPTATADLCVRSGLMPGEHCQERRAGLILPGVPLKRCTLCDGTQPPLSILSPKPQTYVGEAVTLPLKASQSTVRWFVDGQPLPEAVRTVTLTPGVHTLQALSSSDSATLTLAVKAPPSAPASPSKD